MCAGPRKSNFFLSGASTHEAYEFISKIIYIFFPSGLRVDVLQFCVPGYGSLAEFCHHLGPVGFWPSKSAAHVMEIPRFPELVWDEIAAIS